MNKTFVNFFFLALFFLNCSCKGTKKVSEKTFNNYLMSGYTYGIIEPRGSGICRWVISVSGNIFYDPINIEDEKFIMFSLKKKFIFFKYLPLKMKNRCENLAPIQLTEIIAK